jgi:hypothetical protein
MAVEVKETTTEFEFSTAVAPGVFISVTNEREMYLINENINPCRMTLLGIYTGSSREAFLEATMYVLTENQNNLNLH